MTRIESQQERAKYEVGDQLYFRPLADRDAGRRTVSEGLVVVTQIGDHGSPTPWSPRFTYVRAESDTAEVAQVAMSASIEVMPSKKLDTHERAQRANAALTTEQRSAAGKARAAMLHHPTTLARRIAKAWPELGDDDRKAVRRELRAAGVIK